MYFKPLLLSPQSLQSVLILITLISFPDNILNKLEFINYYYYYYLTYCFFFSLPIVYIYTPLPQPFSKLGSDFSNNKFNQVTFCLKLLMSLDCP